MPPETTIKMYKGADGKDVIFRFKDKDGNPSVLPDSFEFNATFLLGATMNCSTDKGGLYMDRDAGEVRIKNYKEALRSIPKCKGRFELIGIQEGQGEPWAGGTCIIESYL